MTERKQTGRPLKVHAPGTEATVSVLMPAELKTQLQEKALEAKRTLSAEAQLRLERSMQSVDRPSLLPDAMQLAFGELGGLVLMIAYAMERAGRLAAWNATKDVEAWRSNAWLANPSGYAAAVVTAHGVLEEFRPPGRVESSGEPFDCAGMIHTFLLNHPDDAPPHAADLRRLFNPATLKRIRTGNPPVLKRVRSGNPPMLKRTRRVNPPNQKGVRSAKP